MARPGRDLARRGHFYDKNWIACDTWPQSPHYGNCYTEWDDNGAGNRALHEHVDGRRPHVGRRAVSPAGLPSGLGGQPVAQPNGNVIVPYEGASRSARSARPTAGHLERARPVVHVTDHGVAGNLRTVAAPVRRGRRAMARSTSSGRTAASGADARRTTSSCPRRRTASTWTAPVADPDRSDHEHRRPLHPGHRRRPLDLGQHSPARTRLLLLPGRRVHGEHVRPHCRVRLLDRRRLDVDAARARLPGRSSFAWIAQTDQGPMVGDYISTSFAGGPLAFGSSRSPSRR